MGRLALFRPLRAGECADGRVAKLCNADLKEEFAGVGDGDAQLSAAGIRYQDRRRPLPATKYFRAAAALVDLAERAR
jgi:hypothetical protein